MLETIVFGIVLAAMYVLHGASIIPMMTAVSAAVILGLAAIVMLVRGQKTRAGELGLRAAVLALSCTAIYGLAALNAGTAVRRAGDIAAACEDYKARTGTYPENLRALVPEYIKDIPAAKFTIMWAQYRLVGSRLMYVREPGMLAAAYDLETKEWDVVGVAEMFPRKGN
ncbi:MAG TPA: hypothetical protein DCW72_00785 [Elusimicrobia bacterium]|nr:MAG: hypothetical protein A2X29_11600 [Elusimicrobia bacterium GWA2_64_40]OGR62453.1 MAG: hypothetical protein A2X30_04645 [Elusimicrobia bacterium GWB2_63_16]HAN05870.1 hypothetical protein [Elusimicrobiota bacterium]HAU88806.1 hypothetical protein [Elusimicrobiota bacterium]